MDDSGDKSCEIARDFCNNINGSIQRGRMALISRVIIIGLAAFHLMKELFQLFQVSLIYLISEEKALLTWKGKIYQAKFFIEFLTLENSINSTRLKNFTLRFSNLKCVTIFKPFFDRLCWNLNFNTWLFKAWCMVDSVVKKSGPTKLCTMVIVPTKIHTKNLGFFDFFRKMKPF